MISNSLFFIVMLCLGILSICGMAIITSIHGPRYNKYGLMVLSLIAFLVASIAAIASITAYLSSQ